MTTFDPPELKSRVVSAFKVLGEFLYFEWDALDKSFEPAANSNAVVNEQTIVESVHFPGQDSALDRPLTELLAWAEGLKTGKLIDRREFRSPTLTIVYVAPVNDLAHVVSMEEVENIFGSLEQTVEVGEKRYTVSLVHGLTLFGLKIGEEGSFDKYNPPCSDQDTFVQVIHPDGDQAAISAIVDAYLYELHSSLGLQYQRSRYVEVEDWETFREEALNEASNNEPRLRPLLVGPGLGELLELFNEASSVGQVEYAVLGYTKVIEYVSATVVKEHAHQAIRTRLLSQAALRPDAAFIEGLTAVVEDQRVFQKDSEAIRLTIENCCDAPQLAPKAPDHLTQLKRITDKSKGDEKKEALKKLAECVSATRNLIVHAKTNFTPKGHECPESQLGALRNCLRLAAEQAIRWFANVPESFRVLKSG